MPLGAAIAGAASLGGGLLANRQNQREAEKTRAFNAAEASKNRDFQERMSNTSYQRAVDDMRAAGINPMLAYQKGGSSTPGGASASGPMAKMQDITSGAVNSAMAAKRLQADLRISAANARAAEAGAEREEATNASLRTTYETGPDGNTQPVFHSGIWPHLRDRTEADTAMKMNMLPYSNAQAQFFGGIGQYAPYAAMAMPLVGAMRAPARLAGRVGSKVIRKGAGVARSTIKRLRHTRSGLPGPAFNAAQLAARWKARNR